MLIHHPKVSRSLGDHKSWSDIAPVSSFKEWLVKLTLHEEYAPCLFILDQPQLSQYFFTYRAVFK